MYALSDAVTRIMYSVTLNRYVTVLRLGINMNHSWKILAVIIAALFIVPLAVTDGADGADSKSFTITDGTGREFTFDGPSEKIVALGKGTNLTIAELGCLDKVVAVDTWSMPAKANDERLSGLNAVDVGSIYYADNNDNVLAELNKLVEANTLSHDDAVILTAYPNTLVLRELLEKMGFTHVLVWTEIVDYETIVKFVEAISQVATGSLDTELVEEMRTVQKTIDDGLKGVAEKKKAVYVRYTTDSGEFTIGNTGSIAVSLIESAGGENIGRNESTDQRRWGDTSMMIQLLEENPDAVVFLDVTWANADHTVYDFRTEYLGGDTQRKVVQLKSEWNNYGPDAMDGLMVVAQSMYPDIFGEYVVDEGGSPGDNNTLLYVGAAVAAIAIIAVAYILLMRRS